MTTKKPTKKASKSLTKKVSKKPAKVTRVAPAAPKRVARTKAVGSKSRMSAKVRADLVDQVLLKLANPPYLKILKQIENGKKRLNEERRLALELGSRILNKAKEVRDTLIQRTRVSRGR